MSERLSILIGGSAGSGPVLEGIFRALPPELRVPLIVLRHMQDDFRFSLNMEQKAARYGVPFREIEDKQPIEAGCVFYAPPGYHLLIEEHGGFALSTEGRVNFSRPSVDVLFESAARAFGPGAVGIILSGANTDGGLGLVEIIRLGGCGIIQNPGTAEFPRMPEAALEACAEIALPVLSLGPEAIAGIIRTIQIERSTACLNSID